MSRQLDISKGVDPVPVYYDILSDKHFCRADGKEFTFTGGLPFTLTKDYCADKALVLKHG